MFDQFNMDREWLGAITKQYMANSLSKFNLSAALQVNGSVMLDTADRLYSEIEVSLFSKASALIDSQEENMESFYVDLLHRLTSFQRHLFKNDTELENLMRGLSIWRMPIIDEHTPQVGLSINQSINQYSLAPPTNTILP